MISSMLSTLDPLLGAATSVTKWGILSRVAPGLRAIGAGPREEDGADEDVVEVVEDLVEEEQLYATSKQGDMSA